MPDMRDAIAQYLAFQGGQTPGGAGMMMGPRAGIPSNLQGYPQLPSGQFLPTPISDTGPQPTQMPSGPPLPRPGTPDADFTGSPPVDTPMQAPPSNWPQGSGGNWPMPPVGPGTGPPGMGPQVAGMDPAEWYRMYTGGR